MSKPIILTEQSWAKIHHSISKEYPHSVLLVRRKMRSVLGFTTRAHQRYIVNPKYDYGRYVTEIHLDFYDEKKRTMFLLKYSHFLEKPVVDNL